MSNGRLGVLVSGAGGKMGREVCRAVIADPELDLVAAVDVAPGLSGVDVGALVGSGAAGVQVSNDLSEALRVTAPDVMVDFTHPDAVLANIKIALHSGTDCVVGTTGIDQDYDEIEKTARDTGRRVFIAANFTIGAVLMMQLSKMAARFMPSAEVIEFHHDQKADSPSGTAVATARVLAEAGASSVEVGVEKYEGARGGLVDGVRVHGVRLPGYVAHQEVIFGSPGQTLTIRHDSIDRQAYMPGVVMAVKKVSELAPLTVGLDRIMELEGDRV